VTIDPVGRVAGRPASGQPLAVPAIIYLGEPAVAGDARTAFTLQWNRALNIL
jgi:hypothetical protein